MKRIRRDKMAKKTKSEQNMLKKTCTTNYDTKKC